jgi:hypothetical protein
MDRIVALAVTLHQTNGLKPRLSIDERSIMDKMIKKACIIDMHIVRSTL